MSEEGLLKKRKVGEEEEEETLVSSASSSVITFFSMLDLVHHNVSPFLVSWADHRALACTTAALWRYYKRIDDSTRVMFFFYGQYPTASLRVRDTFLMDSRDMRCIHWLWDKRRRNTLVSMLAREFCKAGARAGSTNAILRYVGYLNAAEIQSGFGHQIFRTLCKYGHDEEAQAHLLANRWKPTEESAERYVSKLSIVMAPFAHLVPKTFATIKLCLMALQKNFKDESFYIFFLVNACSGNAGYDTRAFDWVWNQLPPGLHTPKEWGILFFKDIFETIEFEPFRHQTIRILSRIPAIVKNHFLEFTKFSDRTTTVTLSNVTLSFSHLPPDAKGETLVSFVFFVNGMRISRSFTMPYDDGRGSLV